MKKYLVYFPDFEEEDEAELHYAVDEETAALVCAEKEYNSGNYFDYITIMVKETDALTWYEIEISAETETNFYVDSFVRKD